ncbi:MAG: pH regulation protein F [Gammaproteobacteria bacterium]|nr:pH regulation protein F [Gammaproteobacteria bacterium]
MDNALLLLAGLLLLNLIAGLWRIWRGPSVVDRMMAAQLFGTTGVAVLLLLAEGQQLPALRDGALIFALLGVLAAVAFVRRGPGQREPDTVKEEP